MDMIQDWTAYLLDSVKDSLPAYYYLMRLAHPYLSQLTTLTTTLKSTASPFLNRITANPDLATLALLLLILILSLKLLDMLWQALVFWVRMVRRVVFWGAVIGLGVWVWARGLDGVNEDLAFWAGVWMEEYEGWKEQERVARVMAQRQRQQPRMGRGGARWV